MHEDLEVIKQVFEHARKGERQRVPDLWSDDIVLHYGGRNPISGTYEGKAAVAGAYRGMAELTGGTFGMIELHDMLATDDHVVVLARLAAERDGARLEWGASTSTTSQTASSRRSGST